MGERCRKAPWPNCNVIELSASGLTQYSFGCSQKSCAATKDAREHARSPKSNAALRGFNCAHSRWSGK
jgi:hypothetical protein